MTLVTVHFDRIFDIVHGTRSHKEVTFFGFESGLIKRYGVAAPGRPELSEGAVVTAILRTPENWQTLVGWVNHTTGEVVVERTGYEAFSIVWCCAVLTFALFAFRSHPVFASIAVAILATWLLWSVRSIRYLRNVRSQLESLRQSGPPNPKAVSEEGGF